MDNHDCAAIVYFKTIRSTVSLASSAPSNMNRSTPSSIKGMKQLNPAVKKLNNPF